VVQLPPLTVFDVETTGLDPRSGHKIIEIAGVRIENGAIREESAFDAFVNPERDIPWEAKQIHKIRDEEVLSAPTIDIVLPQFLEFSAGSLLVAHNAEFDMGFLEKEKECCWGYVELPECLCSMKLSRSLYPAEFRHNLDILAQRLGLLLSPSRHRALADALLTAQVLLKLIEEAGMTSFEQLHERASLPLAVGA
jgi:DNA polymerase III epsilon subunit